MRGIRKQDTVMILSGKDKGKTGKVISVYPKKNRVLVQGINFVKKHKRQTRQDEPGGIVQMESPVHYSNVALVCPRCDRPSRTGSKLLKDGSRVRFCKKCDEAL